MSDAIKIKKLSRTQMLNKYKLSRPTADRVYINELLYIQTQTDATGVGARATDLDIKYHNFLDAKFALEAYEYVEHIIYKRRHYYRTTAKGTQLLEQLFRN